MEMDAIYRCKWHQNRFDRVVSWNIQIFSISCSSTRSVGKSCLYLHERGWLLHFFCVKEIFLDMFVFNSVETILKLFWWDVYFQLRKMFLFFERIFIRSFQKTRSNQYQIFWMTSLITYCDETFVTKLSTIVKRYF